jgi:hypothetical protein
MISELSIFKGLSFAALTRNEYYGDLLRLATRSCGTRGKKSKIKMLTLNTNNFFRPEKN